jgi:hypothetical protein
MMGRFVLLATIDIDRLSRHTAQGNEENGPVNIAYAAEMQGAGIRRFIALSEATL